MQARVEYPKRHSMLLGQGWKAFAHAHSLEDGHILRFKLAEVNMLSFKFYGRTGVCLGCCKEGSSGIECSASNDNGGEGDRGDDDGPSLKPGGIEPEGDSPGWD
ncbi:L-ascorbate oxidase-like protein [Hordeum vulgare]|nr:L-ascorbate oxidase-like protein [Hordeum vulgare]